MLGLMFILVYGTCLLVVPAALGIAVWRWAIKRDKPQAWRWGIAAALIIPAWAFWDYYPTKWTHEYYCEKEAGFWVYKTLDQWKAENPGVMETLVEANNNSPEGMSPNWPTENWNGKKIASINQRFGMLYKNHLSNSEESRLFLNVWRWKTELVDKNTGIVLARQVDFSTGNGYLGSAMLPVKFWLQSDGCIGGREYSKRFGEFLKQFRGAKK